MGKWEGRPTVSQTEYLGSLPIVFFRRMVMGHDAERGSSQGKGVIWESKTHERPPTDDWMDIQIPSIHIFPSLHAPKFFPCNFESRIYFSKNFSMGNWQKIFLKGKGLQDDEEKETIDRSGMEMALGVYQDMQ